MLSDFFATRPVFHTQEAADYLKQKASHSSRTRRNLLHYHLRQGHIMPIRRGLWASVPPGADPKLWRPDPYLVSVNLASDAVLGYRTALALHGAAYTVSSEYVFLTGGPPGTFEWNNLVFRGVRQPVALQRTDQELTQTMTFDRAGVSLTVTTIERTLVDALDRPKLAGGWEEIWRAADAIPYINVGVVVDYTLALRKAITTSKVGYFLEQHREAYGVSDAALDRLAAARSRSPLYADRHSPQSGRLSSRWNLIVPEVLISTSYDELSAYNSGRASIDSHSTSEPFEP
jgi:predicted transcriptional regulator of viral defense system